MNDEQIKKELQKVTEDLEWLEKAEAPLTKIQKRHKRILGMQKTTLIRLQKATEQGEFNAIHQQIAMYGMLSACKDKHPIFLHFARMKMGINI